MRGDDPSLYSHAIGKDRKGNEMKGGKNKNDKRTRKS